MIVFRACIAYIAVLASQRALRASRGFDVCRRSGLTKQGLSCWPVTEDSYDVLAANSSLRGNDYLPRAPKMHLYLHEGQEGR